MALSDSQQLEALLCQVFVPDTQKIKEAENALKQYCKNEQCIPGLLEQMTSSQQPQARQLAAILLRKKLGNHIEKFDAATVEHIRKSVLDHILVEPMHNIRTAIAGVVSSLASATIKIDDEGNRSGGLGLWPKLLEFVAQCANSQEENHRESAFVILEQISESCGEDLEPHFANLNGLFLHALTQDPSRKTQDAALKCVSTLLAFMSMEDEVLVFRDLIGVLLQLAQARMQAAAASNFQDDELLHTVNLVLEVLCDCAMSPIALINNYIEVIVTLCLEVVAKDEIDVSVRDSACLLLNGLAEAKPKQLAKKANLSQIMLELATIIGKSEGPASGELFTTGIGDEEEEEDDDENRDSSGMAQTVLDAIALSVPTKFVFQPAMQIMAQFISNPDPKLRKAGMALLAVITEGCQVPLSEHISEIMPQVVAACGDPDHFVRQSACFALGQISEHCQPEVFQFHEEILPAVFTLFDDQTHQVKGMSCYVLEMFCENLEPETLRPFLEPLMTKLVATLQTHPKKSIQEMVLAAMAAIAVGAEDSFLPFFQPVADLLMQLIFQTEDSMLALRGRALECMGHFAVAVKKEVFNPYVARCMESAVQNLQIADNTDLHEYSYAFFANLVRVLEEEFTPFMAELVPHLCLQLTESDGKDIEFAEKEGGDGLGNFAADSDDEDEDENNYVVNIRTAELEKRKACLTALGAMAQFSGGTNFQPYLESSMQAMEACCEYWNGLVRQEAALSLPQLVLACNKAFPSPSGDQWVKGNPQPMSPQTQQLALACLELLVNLIEGDFEKEVVAKAVESVEVIVSLLGPSILQVYDATKLMNVTMVLLKGEAPCQEEAEDEEEVEEVADHDHVLIDNVADLIGVYAKALGDAFVPFFDGYLEVLRTYLNGTRPSSDRSMAIGCIADCVKNFDSPDIVMKYFTSVADALKLGLADGSYNVRRNSAFSVGIFCQGSKGALSNEYQSLLQALSPLFEPVPNTDGAAMDNAAAAVCRMIKASITAVPLAQVLPVVLNALPLKVDMSENETVYEVLLHLVKLQTPEAMSSLPQILSIFAAALHETSKVDDELKEKLKAAMKDSMVAISDQVMAAMSGLPADVQNFYSQI